MLDQTPQAPSRSYVVPCAAAFRDAVLAAARRRGASPADLARSALLLAGEDRIRAWPDPGEPAPHDRETVTVRSGAARDRALRRKPRLQVRLVGAYSLPLIRKALALALALEDGAASLRIEPRGAGLEARYAALEEDFARAREAVAALGPLPPPAVATPEDALHLLGFPPRTRPTLDAAQARYRRLAKIFHPDGAFGDAARMGQLNEALRILRGRLP